jgi:hypothetical protein
MRINIFMESKISGIVAQIMDKSWECGNKVDVNKTLSKSLCLILSNQNTGKVALLGTMTDMYGNERAEAVMVNVDQWCWAETEGFTRDQIVDDDRLCKRIFKRIPVHTLPQLLA